MALGAAYTEADDPVGPRWVAGQSGFDSYPSPSAILAGAADWAGGCALRRSLRLAQ
jgi:hypothetical protein